MRKLGLVAFVLLFPGVAAAQSSDGFDYPLGAPSGRGYSLTEGLDFEDTYDYFKDTFPEYHTGEDWNDDNSGQDYGGDRNDQGDPVYVVSTGRIVFAETAGASWGHLILVEHQAPPGVRFRLPNGNLVSVVWSQYGHMASIANNPRTNRPWKMDDIVFRGEQIGQGERTGSCNPLK
jgi:murein DD-endopeptidase MepM/ murein hydrolase activator NlpD